MALEKVAREQGLDFVDSCLQRPSISKNGHVFEYRLLSSHREDDTIYSIRFEYFSKSNTLRICSEIPAEQAMPIADFIVNKFLLTNLAEDVSGHHCDEEATRDWMRKAWTSEIVPTFEELTRIVRGEARLIKQDIILKLSPHRPNGDVKYNPILKFLKNRSALDIHVTQQVLKENAAREVQQILDN